MKKRIICMLLAVSCIASFCVTVSAADTSNNSVTPYAITVPTEDAPLSWYNTNHMFTCTSHTYSSYIFVGRYGQNPTFFTAFCNKPFTVEFYEGGTGLLLGTENALYDANSNNYRLDKCVVHEIAPCGSFYVIIRGSNITTADNGYYTVDNYTIAYP